MFSVCCSDRLACILKSNVYDVCCESHLPDVNWVESKVISMQERTIIAQLIPLCSFEEDYENCMCSWELYDRLVWQFCYARDNATCPWWQWKCVVGNLREILLLSVTSFICWRFVDVRSQTSLLLVWRTVENVFLGSIRQQTKMLKRVLFAIA